VVDIPDVVIYTNFGDHRLRGFWVAGGQISPSPIDFHCRPYNTLALPCERVISTQNRVFFTHAQIRNGRIDSNQILHVNSLGGRSNVFHVTSKLVEGLRRGGGCENGPLPLTLALASNTAYCATAHMRDDDDQFLKLHNFIFYNVRVAERV